MIEEEQAMVHRMQQEEEARRRERRRQEAAMALGGQGGLHNMGMNHRHGHADLLGRQHYGGRHDEHLVGEALEPYLVMSGEIELHKFRSHYRTQALMAEKSFASEESIIEVLLRIVIEMAEEPKDIEKVSSAKRSELE